MVVAKSQESTELADATWFNERLSCRCVRGGRPSASARQQIFALSDIAETH